MRNLVLVFVIGIGFAASAAAQSPCDPLLASRQAAGQQLLDARAAIENVKRNLDFETNERAVFFAEEQERFSRSLHEIEDAMAKAPQMALLYEILAPVGASLLASKSELAAMGEVTRKWFFEAPIDDALESLQFILENSQGKLGAEISTHLAQLRDALKSGQLSQPKVVNRILIFLSELSFENRRGIKRVLERILEESDVSTPKMKAHELETKLAEFKLKSAESEKYAQRLEIEKQNKIALVTTLEAQLRGLDEHLLRCQANAQEPQPTGRKKKPKSKG